MILQRVTFCVFFLSKCYILQNVNDHFICKYTLLLKFNSCGNFNSYK